MLRGGRLLPQAAGLVRVPAVIADQVRAVRRDVLRELGDKLQRREELVIPLRAGGQTFQLRIGKGPAVGLPRLVDDLPGLRHLDQPREAERAAGHVLHEALDARLVAGGQVDRLIDAEARVRPAADVLDDFRLDLPLGQIESKNRLLPGGFQPLAVELRHGQEFALGREAAARDQGMDMRVPVEQIAVRLDGGGHAGPDVVATQQAADLGLKARPGAGRQLTQQLAIKTGMQAETLGDYCVFTDPQLGRVGMTEREARATGRQLKIGKIPMSWVARAIEKDETAGLMKIIVDAGTDRILGAAILGIEGGEFIQILGAVMLAGAPYTLLKGAVYIHPTLAEGFWTLMEQVKSS